MGGHMRCEELMERDVSFVSPGDSVLEAARKMSELDVGFLPVCDGGERVVGAITDRDIAVRLVAKDLPSGTEVRDVMTEELYYCEPTDDIRLAEELMAKNQVSRILCIDHGRLVGIISLSDLTDIEEAAEAARTFRQLKAGHRGEAQYRH
ncbi:MAG: CBS domain-containing protein [Deltaproteobacteria bacterium]